jgi:hypothetical protein
MAEKTLNKSKTRVTERESAQTGLDAITKTSIIAMGSISALIGLWALASIVSAMVSDGGPLALVKGWFGAVTGLW